jgi:murein tripeptide amidase MpaA
MEFWNFFYQSNKKDNNRDARAYMLRKHFVFKMIPMLNPDGVANGHYRMDIFNQNLNRFYIKPEPFQQPSAFAVKMLGEYYSS